jgi:hypothetical protein
MVMREVLIFSMPHFSYTHANSNGGGFPGTRPASKEGQSIVADKAAVEATREPTTWTLRAAGWRCAERYRLKFEIVVEACHGPQRRPRHLRAFDLHF